MFVLFSINSTVAFAAKESELPTANTLLESNDALPVNDRLFSLLQLIEQDIDKAKKVFEQINLISDNFNAAEKYLTFVIQGLIADQLEDNEAVINWLNKALALEKSIPVKQLTLPEFSEVHLVLSSKYAALDDFKTAFEHKDRYMKKNRKFIDMLKANKIAQLNEKYATDYKIKQNKLLVNSNKIKALEIKDSENKKTNQQQKIVMLFMTIVVFLLLILRQMKLRGTLKYLAKTDSLTGLYNRRTLFNEGNKLVDQAINENQTLSIIVIDVDFFKAVNDRYGHDTGDKVLSFIAQLGRETMRSRDVFARLGGEEFAGILPGVTPEEAKAIAERLREKIAQFDLSDLAIENNVTVSIGVANLEQVSPQFDNILNAADIAMYYAKANGRNKVYLYDEKFEKMPSNLR
jgi:diguanylate cyclase (GGDEF)-like protein